MVSVVIPCYNSEAYVERAIESVLGQTYKDYELILVDNGSTDNTLRILQEYQSRYPGLIQVLQEPKKGAPAARNRGLRAAKGEWIQFLDSDDELLPEKLQEQLQIAQQSGADLIVGSSYKCEERGGVQERTIVPVEHKNVWKGLINSQLGNTCSNLWKKEAVLRVNGWDESKTSSQEYDLLFRLLQQNVRIAFCLKPQTCFYLRESSVHRSPNKERIAEVVNNNIQLRLRIKEYLNASNKLTGSLRKTIDIRIHRYLMSYRRIIPDYVSQTLNELKLDVPLTYLLKREVKAASDLARYYRKKAVSLMR